MLHITCLNTSSYVCACSLVLYISFIYIDINIILVMSLLCLSGMVPCPMAWCQCSKVHGTVAGSVMLLCSGTLRHEIVFCMSLLCLLGMVPHPMAWCQGSVKQGALLLPQSCFHALRHSDMKLPAACLFYVSLAWCLAPWHSAKAPSGTKLCPALAACSIWT